MKTIYTFLLLFVSATTFSQYCVTGGPSAPADSNVESVSLVGNSGAINFSGCPGITGVQDLTNLSTSLVGGASYSIDIQFGTCGGNYSGKGEVWIDFNGNQIFENSESIGTWTGVPPTAISSFNFTVPAGISNGTTRMRIIQQEGNSVTLPLDPCAQFQWGSVMDFSINFSGGVDCSAYIGNTTADPIVVNSFPYSNIHSTAVCYSNNNNAYVSPDVFYLLVLNSNISSLDVSLCGSSFDTFLSVFDTDGNSISFNDDGSCGAQSELSFSTVGKDSVFVIVEGWGSENGDYEINITETPLGLNSTEELNINLVPNPASSVFTISNLKNSTISIYDLTGKAVIQIDNYNAESIPIDNLQRGIYFVSFEVKGIKKIKKLIID